MATAIYKNMANWLYDAFGYPFDIGSSVAPPDALLDALAVVWWERDNHKDDGSLIEDDVSIADYKAMIQDEITDAKKRAIEND